MAKHRLFLIYGLALLGFTAWTEYRGYGAGRVNEHRVAPKTSRDNPGIYRSMYSNYYRYSGGK